MTAARMSKFFELDEEGWLFMVNILSENKVS